MDKTINKIKIEPKIFQTCIQVKNFSLFDELLDRVDISDWKNQKKLQLLFEFHYQHAVPEQYCTIERYKKVIDVFKINLNGSCWGYTPVTHISSMDNATSKMILDYLLSRPDVDVRKRERRTGLPVYQAVLYDISRQGEKLDRTLIEKLTKKGGNINDTDKEGKNILQSILEYGSYWSDSISENLIKYLLFNTVLDLDHKDKAGKTVMDFAEERIKREKEFYDKAVDSYKKNSWYSAPSNDKVEQAIRIRDLIKARIMGGI